MGLYREYRRLKKLGFRGFWDYHVLSVLRAALALYDLAFHLRYFRAVFRSYRRGEPLPPLHLRGGIVLFHEPFDPALDLGREVIARRWYRRGVREDEGAVMVDIGANIGLVALDWAFRIPNVVVDAYEPDPRTFAILRRNVEENNLSGRIRLFNEAVAAKPGTLTLYRTVCSATATALPTNAPDKGSADSARVDPERRAQSWADALWHARGEPVMVAAVTLDTVFARALDKGEIGLVKLDIEGSESSVLEAVAPATLAQARQYVVEYHERLCQKARLRCVTALERAGFRCRVRRVSVRLGLGLIYARRQGLE